MDKFGVRNQYPNKTSGITDHNPNGKVILRNPALSQTPIPSKFYNHGVLTTNGVSSLLSTFMKGSSTGPD